MAEYYCHARPDGIEHGHPYLVFDCKGELHLPLTVFAKEALKRLASTSIKKYLTGILPWFSWLETDAWQVKANHQWTDPPEVLRDVLREYLVSRLQCRIKPCQDGGEWLETTEEATNHVRILLSSLKLFYRIARTRGYYHHDNPLIGAFSEPVKAACEQLVQDGEDRPRLKMPDISGVDAPHRFGRLTDSYFLLKETWIPQVVTDTNLPQKLLDGGRTLKVQGKDWGLREECLVCLLFETGARISELMTLTLGDWESRGLKETAWARNKGSRKRRAKFVRFSQQTVKLLKKYIDTERVTVDSNHYTLNDYLSLVQQKHLDLNTIPLFLSKRGTPWSVDSFRTNYWKKACAAARIDTDIHQARHWYVNQALAEIYEQARKGKTTVEQGKEELIAYMHWRAGEKTLKAYDHFFKPTHHATVQNSVFKKLRQADQQRVSTRRPRKVTQLTETPVLIGLPAPTLPMESQPESTALYQFLVGKGGYDGDISSAH